MSICSEDVDKLAPIARRATAFAHPSKLSNVWRRPMRGAAYACRRRLWITFIGVVTTVLLLFQPTALFADVVWRYGPQNPAHVYSQPIFIDLDLDGTREIVTVGNSQQDELSTRDNALQVFKETEQGLSLVHTKPVGRIHSQLITVPRAEGEVPAFMFTATIEPYSKERLLVEVEGSQLDTIKIRATEHGAEVFQVADIDGDGELEILQTVASQQYITDYMTGDIEWAGTLKGINHCFATPLDSDPALEIVVAGSITRVIDGATRIEEWRSPVGMFGRTLAGRFSDDPSIPTFAVDGNEIQIFRGEPYSLLRTLSADLSSVTAFDVDGDAIDEFVGRDDNRAISAIEPITGAEVAVLEAIWDRPAAPGVGSLEAVGSTLVVDPGSNFIDPGMFGLRVIELENSAVRYEEFAELGPFRTIAQGDVNDDSSIETVLFSGRHSSHPAGLNGAITVMDDEGDALIERVAVTDGWIEDSRRHLHVTDLDGVPGDEIILSWSRFSDWSVAVLNGNSLQDQWRMSSATIPQAERGEPTGMDSLYFDDDEVMDVAIALKTGAGSKILVLSGDDGDLLWQSVTLKGDFSSATQITIANIDNDPSEEILLATANGTYAFDSRTRLLDWSISAAAPLRYPTALATWGEGEKCRVGVGSSTNEFQIYRCDTQSLLTTLTVPAYTTMIIPLDPQGSRFALTASAYVWTLRADGYLHRESERLGDGLAGMPADALRLTEDDNAPELLVGSGLMAARIRISPDDVIFGNGFRPLGGR